MSGGVKDVVDVREYVSGWTWVEVYVPRPYYQRWELPGTEFSITTGPHLPYSVYEGKNHIQWESSLENAKKAVAMLLGRREQVANQKTDAEDLKRLREIERQLLLTLDRCPIAVRVREGGGPEDVAASVTVTLSKLGALK